MASDRPWAAGRLRTTGPWAGCRPGHGVYKQLGLRPTGLGLAAYEDEHNFVRQQSVQVLDESGQKSG